MGPLPMICKISGDGSYTLSEPTSGIEFRADHLRRDHRTAEINGELTVSAGIIGARTVDGILSQGTFNFSSVPARKQRATILRERARTSNKIDFHELLEAFCQYISAQEKIGAPAVTLRDVPVRSSQVRFFDVLGLRLPMNHMSMLFGAADTLKSFLALDILAEVAAQGGRGLYCDWELNDEDHRLRLGAICGPTMPEAIKYCKCERPLVVEIDRLRRIVRAEGITYAVLDSVAYGTLGDPAEAGPAMDYCRAVGQLGVGALAIAHITKTGDQNDQMPYGSVFWNASARMTWNVKRSETSDDGEVVMLGCFNRKSNLGAKRPAVGVRVQFDQDRTTFSNTDLATIDDMAQMLPLWQRIRQVVLRGPQPLHAIASALDYDNTETLERTVRRRKDLFTKITGADGIHQIALVEKRRA